MTTPPEALFEAAGPGAWLPSGLARGPWDPRALHGGPVSALLARVVEGHEPPDHPMAIVRLTVELTRPVPLSVLTSRARTIRPGRKVHLAEAALFDGDTEVARATALRIRAADVDLPDGIPDDPAPVPGPADAAPTVPGDESDLAVYHRDGAEHRFVSGSWYEPGPVVTWVRLRAPVVAGEEPTPLQRVAAAADFGSGVSGVVPYDEFVYINPDLTIHVHRAARGEWVGLDARTFAGDQGIGMAEAGLYDTDGRIGRCVQSLLLDRR